MLRNFAVMIAFTVLLGGGYTYDQEKQKQSCHDLTVAKAMGGQNPQQPSPPQPSPPEPPPQPPPDPDPEQNPEQDPGQPPQPEGNKRCERPDPNGDPNVGGTDPNKIGCTCMRKCENGKPTENYDLGKRCKVHCKPDLCDCPNPCKT